MAKYIKGLNKDAGSVDQPEGTYRYARNAVISKTKGAISNEYGTSTYTSVGNWATILGTIEITDGRIVVFTVDEGGGTPGSSRISLVSDEGITNAILYTNLGNAPNGNDFDLKFNLAYPIEGSYKIDPDGNLIIYWTDNFNPPRSLNVTRQEPSANNMIYGVNPFTSPNRNYVDRLNLFPHSGPVPKIEFSRIANGGALKSGVYHLFLAYVDQNFTQTNFVSYSLGVPIVEDDEGVRPIERYDGCRSDSQTGKSIVWDISNLNTDYEYLRAVVVARIDSDTEFAYKLNDIDISNSTSTIVFSMLEGYASSSVEEAIIDTVAYDTAKTLTQLDGVLYMGNLQGSRDVGYQPNANYISLSTVVDQLDPFDGYQPSLDNLEFGYLETEPPASIVKDQGFRDINKIASTTGNRRGYTRDEVYAFYIAFILNDGTMSYAYHIPGREKLKDSVSGGNILKVGSVAAAALTGSSWDEDDDIIDPDLVALTQTQGKLFHFYDFSVQSANSTNYWENKNEFYPNTDNFKVFNGIEELPAQDLRGAAVRHHRMPTNKNPERELIIDESLGEQGGEPVEITTVYATVWGGNDGNSSEGWLEEQDSNSPPILIMPNSALFPTEDITWDGMSDTFSGGNGFVDGIQWIEGQTGVWDDYWEYGSYPSVGQQGVLCWFKNGTSEGAGWCEVDAISDSGLILNQGLGYAGASNEEINSGFNNCEFACFVWWDTVTVIEGGQDPISHEVQPLGVQLSDIKIPQTIADQIQGFRIYYAERNHANRRVLGQDLVKNTKTDLEWADAELGGCNNVAGNGSSEPFILAPGTLYNGNVNVGVFHDQYLLNHRHSLVPATHTTHEYNVQFVSYRGAGHFYTFTDNVYDDACIDKETFVSFHIGGTYTSGAGENFMQFPLREKCKTYLQGDSIYDGRALGFGKRIYNIGGESSILLGYKINRTPNLGAWLEAGQGASWHEAPGAEATFSFAEENFTANAAAGELHNLQAFKTDMYLSFDTQELVWTGYEILGDELDNFVLNEDGSQPNAQGNFANFGETGEIWGGDTFICRHGYRITHRPEMAGVAPQDHKCVLYTICESSNNINFRHEDDLKSSYFPGSPAKKILDIEANEDLTKEDQMRYSMPYSLGVADIKPAIPLPLRESDPTIFRTRVQRSAKDDNVGLIDNYRVFLAGEYKDLPRNRGDLWKLVTFNNLLYLHTEDSLFKTKGKQSMQMGDASEAFVGSGDIFAQDPDELVQTEAGYGGTSSQWVSTVTKHGYFCLDVINTKVFLVKDQLYDISKAGLEDWFRTNIPYALFSYGLPASFDNPIAGIGFHAVWDETNERILLTKRDLVPTALFISDYEVDPSLTENHIGWSDTLHQYVDRLYMMDLAEEGMPNTFTLIETPLEWSDTDYFTPAGWTISYDPTLSMWVSFHDYVPYIYSYSNEYTLSAQDGTYSQYLWSHSNKWNPGMYYNNVFPFEFEFIYNKSKEGDKVFYSFNYTLDVFSESTGSQSDVLIHDQGFTSFYVYNTHQISDERELEYMMNVRRIGNEWKVNKFRDLASLLNNNSAVYTGGAGGHMGSNFGVTGVNVAGTVTANVETTTINTMFIVDGMSETINNNFIDLAKSWDKQKKFTDKWLGIRLICSNSNKNLINLYATDVAAKKFYR
jgi:hypothetical protein